MNSTSDDSEILWLVNDDFELEQTDDDYLGQTLDELEMHWRNYETRNGNQLDVLAQIEQAKLDIC